MWDLGLDQRFGQRAAVRLRRLVEAELDARIVAAERHSERAELLLELGEQLVDLGFELLRDDDLVAFPHVCDVGLGERLGQLDTLVDRPSRHVVMDLDGVRIVRVPVEHEARR